MCMCGGIIEVGIITALVGYIGKRIHKCKCDCHEEHIHKCKHCSVHSEKQICVVKNLKNLKKMKIGECMIYDINRNKRKQLFYKIIQYILGSLIFGGLIFASVGIYKMLNKHHDCTEIHCSHNTEK